jgi:N-acetylneuraminic acid mutarotase
VLVAAGGNGYLTSAELYTPATGTWTTTGSLNTSRTFDTMTLLTNGQVLVAGGLGQPVGTTINILASAELYDPSTGIWKKTGSLNTARTGHTATLLSNGQILVAAGEGSSFLTSAELYDPSKGKWTLTGSLNNARDQHAATLLSNGQVLVAGGSNGNAYLASAELYNPSTGVWTTTGSLNTARACHTMTLLSNGQALVVGGVDNNSNALASAELYTP